MSEYKWRQQYRCFPPQLLPPVTQDDIIIVTLMQDGAQIDYRLRTCNLSTKQYGEMLATILNQIASMMGKEGLDEGKCRAEMIYFLNTELLEPTATVDLHQLQ